MARKPRIESPGALYHVMSRGNRGDRGFLDDDDRALGLKTFAENLEMGHPGNIPKVVPPHSPSASKCSATSFSFSRIGIPCGHASSQEPHSTQREARSASGTTWR